MDILILRLIHIGAGVFWVGSVFTFFLFVQPAAAAVGPDATKFTYRLLHHQRLSVAILSAAIVTVLAGATLRCSHGRCAKAAPPVGSSSSI